jgi:hypothetical protein
MEKHKRQHLWFCRVERFLDTSSQYRFDPSNDYIKGHGGRPWTILFFCYWRPGYRLPHA